MAGCTPGGSLGGWEVEPRVSSEEELGSKPEVASGLRSRSEHPQEAEVELQSQVLLPALAPKLAVRAAKALLVALALERTTQPPFWLPLQPPCQPLF